MKTNLNYNTYIGCEEYFIFCRKGRYYVEKETTENQPNEVLFDSNDFGKCFDFLKNEEIAYWESVL